eukprot:30065-Pelagococcus_subviridis.AAC.1
MYCARTPNALPPENAPGVDVSATRNGSYSRTSYDANRRSTAYRGVSMSGAFVKSKTCRSTSATPPGPFRNPWLSPSESHVSKCVFTRFVSGFRPITDVPVNVSRGFQKNGTSGSVISIVHRVESSQSPVAVDVVVPRQRVLERDVVLVQVPVDALLVEQVRQVLGHDVHERRELLALEARESGGSRGKI